MAAFKDLGSILSETSPSSPTKLDRRQFDGQLRPWHEGMPEECYCNGKKFVLDDDGLPSDCVCSRDGWAERCRRACGISEETLNMFTFKTWVDVLNPSARGHKNLVQRYATKDSGVAPWLVLFGLVGTGKTHLLIALVGALADRGVSVSYYNAYEMEAEMRQAIESNGVREYVQRMANAPVLVIDDLGKEMTSKEFVSGTFFRILNQRHEARRRTVIAFNPDGFEAQDASLRSRLTDAAVCQILEFNGPDIRSAARMM